MTLPGHFGPWDDAAFERAGASDRLVLLSIGTKWCHWCHVMEETTWADAAVQAELTTGFVAIRVDAETRPDLAARYEDYGWPATIVLHPNGTDLVKLRGYVPPERMLSLLRAVRADPTPGPSAIAGPAPVSGPFDDALRAELVDRSVSGWDEAEGGWGTTTKYLDLGNLDWSLARGRTGDDAALQRARTVVDKTTTLVDPVWGGAFQYSEGGVWDKPHFEKIAWVQAADLTAFACASALWGGDNYRQAGDAIVRYVDAFFTADDGAFYTSQDADLVRGQHAAGYFDLDDAGRRAQGMPFIDTSVWPRENGLIIEAFAWRAMWLGDDAARDRAVRAWLAVEGRFPMGDTGPMRSEAGETYLGDVTAMGKAAFTLWQATGDDVWLERSMDLASTVPAYRAHAGGFVTSLSRGRLVPFPSLDENVELSRWAKLLAAATGDVKWKEVSAHALLAVAERVRAPRLAVGAALLADAEHAASPLDVKVVGSGPLATELWRSALADPSSFRLIRRWEGAGSAPDWATDLPELDGATSAFVCRQGTCVEVRDASGLRVQMQGGYKQAG